MREEPIILNELKFNPKVQPMKRKLLLISSRAGWLAPLLLLLLLAITAQAQTIVRGKVTDESGTGMPGVNIVVKGTSSGTTTDVNGEYTLQLPDGDGQKVIVFSFIGYETQEQIV